MRQVTSQITNLGPALEEVRATLHARPTHLGKLNVNDPLVSAAVARADRLGVKVEVLFDNLAVSLEDAPALMRILMRQMHISRHAFAKKYGFAAEAVYGEYSPRLSMISAVAAEAGYGVTFRIRF